jgi:16S rRNA (adenine1518-N6/adenine1519-N6)-dimethyltransferase
MDKVRAKKHLGQHFLKEPSIAEAIAGALTGHRGSRHVLEIGPGTGILTRALMAKALPSLKLIEIDRESVAYLKVHHPELNDAIIEGDFLKLPLEPLFDGESFAVAGNFPYNISSQILFRLYDYPDLIPELVGMFQKEVAERIVSPPGNKDYGILSVLLQAFYTGEYLFTVHKESFIPPPKVESGVIRLLRNERTTLPIPASFFKHVVKTAFGQRRKTLRNSLSSLLKPQHTEVLGDLLTLRPERLSSETFISLATTLYADQ